VLPLGYYELGVQEAGSAEEIQKDIHLVVGQDAGVDLTLQVGKVSEQLTVTAEASPVNVTTQDISGLVGERQVKGLPLNGRSYDLLTTLNPAVVNFASDKTGGAFGAQPFCWHGGRDHLGRSDGPRRGSRGQQYGRERNHAKKR